jgi:hypothetical protein
MNSVTTRGENVAGIWLFHIQPLGSSLFCETRGDQATKLGGILLSVALYRKAIALTPIARLNEPL